MESRRKLPLIWGAGGILHIFLVGIPFIRSGGGGEDIAYRTLFLDFPLSVLGEMLFPRLLLGSVRFNFFWFVVLGTILYVAAGYAFGVFLRNRIERANTTNKRRRR